MAYPSFIVLADACFSYDISLHLRSRAAVELENLALRHQIDVFQRSAARRPN